MRGRPKGWPRFVWSMYDLLAIKKGYSLRVAQQIS